jgi:hypothetical protein
MDRVDGAVHIFHTALEQRYFKCLKNRYSQAGTLHSILHDKPQIRQDEPATEVTVPAA